MTRFILVAGALLAASSAWACSSDNECHGERVCVDGRCQDPSAPHHAATPPRPAQTQRATSDDDGLLSMGDPKWSTSFLIGVAALSGSSTGFAMNAHGEGGIDLNRYIAAMGFADLGVPIFDGTADFYSDLGVGIGVGKRYRLMLGAGLAVADNTAAGQFYVGGGALLHGSIPLTTHWGIHTQLSIMAIAGTGLIQFGLGVGYQE